jgi:endonuclease/exonuclease/phosphatase family metal-dependent hydrolase
MPNYTWLRPRSSDTPEELEAKRRAARKIQVLRAELDAHIQSADLPDGVTPPSDTSRIVRIATWNLREFDSPSYGYRTQEAKAYIAEILSAFDLVALQEIRRDLGPLEEVVRLLGPDWDYITTDVTAGDPGNKERMAYLYNEDRVRFRKVAGELTLPKGQQITDPFGERFRIEGGPQLDLGAGNLLHSPTGLKTKKPKPDKTTIEEDVEIPLPAGAKVVLPPGSTIRFPTDAVVPLTPEKGIAIEASPTPTLPEAAEIVLPPNSLVGGPQQFARTPYVVSFQTGWLKLYLTTVHIYYGTGSAGMERRTEEIHRLVALLAERAQADSDSDADAYFVVLGDFNIVGPGHATMDALLTNDFMIPEPLQHVPGSNVEQDKFYDQIALWNGKSKRRRKYTRIIPYRAGVFDYFEHVFTKDEEAVYQPFMVNPQGGFYKKYLDWRTHQMSDHLPMWVELHIDFAHEYLDQVEATLEQKIKAAQAGDGGG